MSKTTEKSEYIGYGRELTEDELEFVAGGAEASTASAVTADVPDSADVAERRKSSGAGMIYLVFNFKLVAV